MSTSVSDDNLEKKFQAVTNTQDSIQTLSLWILHHKAHHQKIVTSWMKVLKKTKISHRLTLFYLANDVVQNGKRKGFLQFGNSFAEVLREATLLVRDEQIRPSIQRVFTIWEQRNIYSPEYIADLRAILANTKVPATAHSKLLAEFKPDTVIDKLRVVMQLEMEVETKVSTINLSKLNATNAEIVQQLKDRTHGQQFKREFDESTRCLDELIKTLNREVKERAELILLMEQSEIYYDTQRGEAKIVANAYKNFGTRVKTLQKKLEELAATFPSPVPSPCPDAPSPTNSDLEMELSLPNDRTQTNELENLENAPSPVGTPEGLNLSPVTKPVETESEPVSTQSVGNPIPTLSNFFSHAVLVRTTEGLNLSPAANPVETETQPVSTQSVGNPIPTLSNFFSNEQSGMTSWLDTFASKKKPFSKVSEKNEVPTSDSSSLDSRLSTLLQNIPNLPSGLQSTIFGNASSGNNTPLHDSVNSPLINKKETDSTTPIKDEYSGQNTPLQDEESTHSSHAFFSKITSSSKSKDILTSLIQSVSTDKTDDSQKKDKFGFGTIEPFDQGGMSSFIKKIIPSVSAPRSSPSFYNSTQPTLSSVQAAPIAQTSTINSYETACFQDVPVYSSKPSNNQTEQLSFIPSLVPSMPQDSFSYEGYSPNEYNPELETFDTEIDVENALGDVLSEQSPPLESLSPVASPTEDDIPRSLGSRRLSTLITVVTKDSPDNSLPSPEYSSKDTFKSDKENVTQEPQWNNDLPKNDDIWTKDIVPQESIGNSPNEEFFIGKEAATLPPPFYTSMPPPVIDHHHKPPNGQNINYFNPVNNAPSELPLSKIETVQSQRDEMNGRWYGNNYPENDRRPPPLLPRGPPPMPCGMQETRFFDKRNFPPPPPFRPRNNWAPRHRPEHFHHPYGTPPSMKRFPFRGRGRGRPYPQY